MPAKASEKTATPVEDEEEDLFRMPTTIEPDTYVIKCEGLRRHEWPGENKFKPGAPNESLMWNLTFARRDEEDGTLEIVMDENTGDPYINEFPTTMAMSAKAKAYKYATAFLKRPPKPEEIRSVQALARALVGKKALATMGQKESGYPEIVDVYPYMGK